MKKSSLFLSVAITAFILVILASVIFKARASGFGQPTPTLAPIATLTESATDTLQPTDTPADTATIQPSPTIAAFISPQEAAFIAASALGNTQIFSIDTITRYGIDVYQVNFSSGAIVFVSPQGHILTITSLQSNVAPPQAAAAAPASNNSSGSSSPSRNSGGDDGGSGGDN
jgi:hypothetical protein